MKTPTIALSLLLLASAAQAQRLTETRTAATPALTPSTVVVSRGPEAVPGAPRLDGHPRNTAMAFTGTLFAIAGMYGGAYTGAAAMCSGNPESMCDLGGAILGALAGEVLMLPLGVHFASSNTSYARKLLASTIVMGAGIVFAPATAGISLLAVPPVQLMTLMNMENRAPERTR
jgi:hypothetical protein